MSESLARVWAADEKKLWIPEGSRDIRIKAIQSRLTEYDENLLLGRHEGTGDWCIFIRYNPVSKQRSDPFPVLGLGKGELPSADEIMEKVQKHDTLRYGKQMLAEMNKHNETIQGVYRDAASEGAGVVAEAMESFLHANGRAPYLRSLRPLKKTAVRKG